MVSFEFFISFKMKIKIKHISAIIILISMWLIISKLFSNNCIMLYDKDLLSGNRTEEVICFDTKDQMIFYMKYKTNPYVQSSFKYLYENVTGKKFVEEDYFNYTLKSSSS